MNPRTFTQIALKGLIIGAGAVVGMASVVAWTGPSAAPPNSNVAAPLNVGATSQTKNGALGVNSLAVYGNMQVNGAISAPEGVLRDDNGGWVRTYGATGWYSQTYGGGWYMTDTTWLRAYNGKSVTTTGTLSGGTVATTDLNMSEGTIRNIHTLSGRGASPGNIFIPSNVQINGGVSLVGGANIYGSAWFSGLGVDMPNLNSGNGNFLCWNTSQGRLRQQSANCGSSDLRLKEHIAPLQSGLAEILKLNPVSYEWKDKDTMGEGTKIGLIAQEVKEVLPELITGTGTGVDGDWYGVDYNGLIAPMINAIKELKAENDALRAHNQTVEERLSHLEELINRR